MVLIGRLIWPPAVDKEVLKLHQLRNYWRNYCKSLHLHFLYGLGLPKCKCQPKPQLYSHIENRKLPIADGIGSGYRISSETIGGVLSKIGWIVPLGGPDWKWFRSADNMAASCRIKKKSGNGVLLSHLLLNYWMVCFSKPCTRIHHIV